MFNPLGLVVWLLTRIMEVAAPRPRPRLAGGSGRRVTVTDRR